MRLSVLELFLVTLLPFFVIPCRGLGDRHEVHKRAQPPGGDGGRPITGLDDAVKGSRELPVRTEKSEPRPQFLDVRKLLQLVFSQSNVSGRGTQPELSRHMDASMAELVAVQTLHGDVAWIEAKFVNESHQPSRRRRTRPYNLEERLALLLPVTAFLLPFLVWICCMVTCIRRSFNHNAAAY